MKYDAYGIPQVDTARWIDNELELRELGSRNVAYRIYRSIGT